MPPILAIFKQSGSIKRYFGQIKHRRAHVDRDAAIALQPRLNHAAQGFDFNGVFDRQPLLAHELQEAARAVAALLNFTTIGIVNHVLKIDIA